MDYSILNYLFILTFIFAGTYLLITVVIHIGLSKRINYYKKKPKVSVLVAARNEAKVLPHCLQSLSNQDYPNNLLEILILNDRSQDETEQITKEFIFINPVFRLLNINSDIIGLQGKMNVLCQGIELAKGEIILITDADCIVPKDWVSNFIKYFGENTGLVGGLSLLTQGKANESFFSRLQAVDWIFLLAIASGTAGIGLPVSVLGNNFGFRKKAYEDVGGFRNLPFSVTEDMTLMKAISDKTDWEIVYPLETANAIYSSPAGNLKEFYQQRKRWTLGGKGVSVWGYIMMVISLGAHFFIMLPFILLFITPHTLLSFGILMISDFSIIFRLLKRLKLLKLILYFPVFELFYFIYTAVFTAVAMVSKNVSWKGRAYSG